MADRVRWRITLDQLLHATGVTGAELDRWRRAGYLGARVAEGADQGFGRHITREVAQRAVLMARCVDAGITEEVAARLVADHVPRDNQPIVAKMSDTVTIKVSKEGLP